MKSFNINNYILIEITEYGWECLNKSLSNSEEYIKHCILPNKQVINGKEYYKLQAHQVMELFGSHMVLSFPTPISSNILIQENYPLDIQE
jgi:hypothetical protein